MPIEDKHHVIVIPGLGDDGRVYKFATKSWDAKYGLTPHIHLAPWSQPQERSTVRSWNTEDEPVEFKLLRLGGKIRQLRQSGKVSLIGISASGSLAVNALARDNEVGKVVCICSRLKLGSAGQLRPYGFHQAVVMCENRITGRMSKGGRGIPPDRLEDILALRALFDEIVPGSTSTIDGAHNEYLLGVFHILTHYGAMFFPRRVVDFIRN